uniref:ParB/RepB/Spo0J family partition protein n=1 Tax=Serratia proteamaculans TaxID=28151 RepID=UPI001F4C0F63|nr:ParB/RepB/Spo0J family partition protein [Serratia proteamaculans]ULG15719.1 chromosome partitioning protein [Serratia proteamaculans]
MSNIDTKAPTKAKSTPKKSATKAAATNDSTQFVEETLANAPVEVVMLKQLAKTSLNARKTPAAAADIEGRATSIEGVGVLQNLVVFRMVDGQFGVAAGETRRLALNLLMEQGRSAAGVPVTPEFPVVVKVVDEDKARAISYAENGQRSNLTPADQLANFRDMAEDGTPVEKIAAILGYRTAHVRKCLKLTTVAPQLQELLKTDQITLDQLGALAATDDHQRQCQVWNNARHHESRQTVKALRESVLNNEVAAADSKLVTFVGLDAYKAAGGETREDLFAESVFLTNPIQLETLAIAKLQDAADEVAKKEGWSWALGRYNEVSSWEDEKSFSIIRLYSKLTDDQRAEIKQLEAEQEVLEDLLEGADADDDWEHAPRLEQINARVDEINDEAEKNLWKEDVRAKAGVVAYLKNGKICLQRGIMKMDDIKQEKKAEREKNKVETPPSEKGLSQALITSLSAERTLAVAATLAQNPTVALAMHTYKLARSIFDNKGYYSVMHTTVESQRNTCLKQAADADIENGLANQKLTELHESWLSQFPQDWTAGFDWLLAWPQADVLALLTYCVAQGIDGVSAQIYNQRVSHSLAPVEKALDFQIGDWWKPTSANYFSRIGKDQIVDALNSAGKTGKASDAEKLTRKDAAEFAEAVLKETDWLPGCMTPAEAPQEDAESTGNADATDIDNAANDNQAA